MAYRVLYDAFTHHREAIDVPEFFTHAKIWAILTPALISLFWHPRHAIYMSIAVMLYVFPVFYFTSDVLRNRVNPSANFYQFYQNGVSQAEIDKIEYEDEIEFIGDRMKYDTAYGYTRYKNFKGEDTLY